ncbi:extracellular solute-binding protein [Anaerocolumna sedimenticola]|uniref:Extracellular solute-binding protein n=1 Tax=Anaerocolumna sedimenticola TaxID=2696063 RepID=A0A6P1TM38_9FIRM|nr:extracellular solute-binding protein [Anaerocolumna sedimenticola]QHQ61011.1 extracellular solute-binding protein [Anaerocolumna sedimenticola]
MKKRLLSIFLIVAMVAVMITGCGKKTETSTNETNTNTGTDTAAADTSAETAGTTDSGDKQVAKKIKILSIWAEDKDNGKLITDLTKKYIAEVNPNFEYEFELVSADNLKQKISTLVASDDLPDVFVYESGKPIVELIEAGKLLDVGKALEDLGVADMLDEGAVSLLKTLSGTDELYDLPLGMNVEGFWYNKALFEQAGVEVPATWEDFEAACAKLQAAGIQPLTAGGADKWPLTRLINAYVMRSMGVDAMQKAANGEAKYTDPGYVAAAQKLQDLAAKGYFGEGVTTVDQNTAGNMLLSGEAAMFYNGSWFTEALTADTNPAGADGIGFFNIPVVDETKGTITEYSMNCGNILALDKAKYDEGTAGWLKYMVENLGNEAMTQFGAVKGYKYDVTGELSTYSQIVADELGKVTKASTWFEAAMNSETSTVAQDNVQTLVNGDSSAQDYMQSIQDAYDGSQY